MDFQKLLLKIAQILESLDIPYAITGGYAVSLWGRARSTLDIDVIIELFQPKVKALVAALKKISELSYVEEGVVQDALERVGEFNFIHGESSLKVDFWISKGKIGKQELSRRIVKKIDGQSVYFLSPEDLILSKLRWFKESQSQRHLEDIESILERQKGLDREYLKKESMAQATFNELESLLKQKL